ncbi:WASH complex subunit 1 [Harmonia axyridis]|uniref:WASH complex subunit 1 n=1 Tax=Harmonia axyridis TaxID=115357 RepID=UPI001E276BF1|nr:WASH complex subunit 1 [Harmonia axyridis]
MIYKVNLIPPNLRKNETIVQIADSLDYLSKVVDDMMLHIENRIDIYNNKLQDVSNRVGDVERKISQIRGVKNAIQVFSSSKYPVNCKERNYISIFPTKSDIPLVKHEVSEKYPLKKDEPIDKLHIYHVKISKLEPEKIEGLGQVPNDASCISDLILYNSGKNPYREFNISTSLQVPNSSVRAENNKINIGTAPASIVERSLFTNLPSQEYFYSPDLGDVPSLDVPLDLPDLPGIAGNVRYEEDINLGIAPSVLSPTLKSDPLDQKILNDDLKDLPEIIPSSPSPIQEKNEIVPTIETVKVEEQLIVPMKDIKTEQPNKKVENREKDSKLPVHDARSSLMEAIREAGGSKALKSTDKTLTPSKNETSGDLMADLHSKLAMRRKGISGAKKDNKYAEMDSRDALNLISALIPPPEEINDETDHDEDWE